MERLARRVDEILSVVRPRAARRVPTRVRLALERTLWQWEALGPEVRNIAVFKQIPDPLPEILVDPEHLDQILLNLLLNAKDAMAGSGTLFLSASEEPPWVVIRIRDTGCGIPAENLKHIFDPFFTTKPGGTGLGLANVWKLVEHNGGQVAVSSEPGQGTEFTLRFPAVT